MIVNNLKFKSMAKYQNIVAKDITAYEQIEKDLFERPDVRGMALRSESIRDLERHYRETGEISVTSSKGSNSVSEE